MALQKQPISINFTKGLNTKDDPYQVPVGNFLTLVNSVFDVSGRLTKRFGYQNITRLPDDMQTTLTTLNDNLIATGSDLLAFSKDTNQWLNKGTIQPIQLGASPLVRSSTEQTSPDIAVSSTGLTCLVYIDSGSTAYYQVSDSDTGQLVVNRTALPATATSPRVFLIGPYFIITFMATVSGSPHLQYIALPTANPGMAGTAVDFSTDVNTINSGYDGYVFENVLYLAWEASASNVKVAKLDVYLAASAAVTIAGADADLMSVTVDPTAFKLWVSYWDSGSQDGFSAAFNLALAPIVAPTQIITNQVINEITSAATGDLLSTFHQVTNSYGYSGGGRTDYIQKTTVTPPGSGIGPGTPTGPTVVVRSVGLASKAFIANDVIYMLATYGDTDQSPSSRNSNQPSYFLIDSLGNVYMRLAYSNGGGYEPTQVLPNVTLVGDTFYLPYLITDFLTTVNKGTNLPANTPVNAIYTQTGVNLAKFTLDDSQQYSSEIAGALHLTGGQLWEYDGVKPVEHGFQVWPENIVGTTSTTGGLLTAQLYEYVFTYEWTDNAGMLHRSAPSIPLKVNTTGSTSSNTLNVPTLRLTYKIAPNPVRIVGYRWSVAQQSFFQFTSVTSPTYNNTAIDYVTFVDTQADAAILGNTLLYTTGNVVENIAAPASIASALFANRLFLIDAEDRNLLWYSKVVIQNVPVEMSDLLTLYVAPTTGAQGSTGDMQCLSAMDDKLIIFKRDAIYYINGSGPDNTGANSTFSDPIFITATVGSSNQNSIVLIPNGLMFQSDKGIWLLGRDLSTNYIGAPVEIYNNDVVMSAEAIPGTNQVKFILASGITLMYDYFFNQWGTHTNVNAISATLYQSKHTYLNQYGQVLQETDNTFNDGGTPVLMSLTTAWINIAGLQGLERFYFANLLGTYYTPFRLNVTLAYDYNSSATQAINVLPDNYGKKWGDEALWGSGAQWGGGPGNVFSARLFPSRQKCQSFQVVIQEVYDPTYGQSTGEGLSLSGLALVVGMKKGYRTQKASRSFG